MFLLGTLVATYGLKRPLVMGFELPGILIEIDTARRNDSQGQAESACSTPYCWSKIRVLHMYHSPR